MERKVFGMKKQKKKYIVQGYLVDYFGNRITKDFTEQVMATSFDEAENRVKFRIKTQKLNMQPNTYVKLVQGEDQDTYEWF